MSEAAQNSHGEHADHGDHENEDHHGHEAGEHENGHVENVNHAHGEGENAHGGADHLEQAVEGIDDKTLEDIVNAVREMESTGEVPDVLRSNVMKDLLDTILSVRDGIGNVVDGIVVKALGKGVLNRMIITPIKNLVKAVFHLPGDTVRLGKYIATTDRK